MIPRNSILLMVLALAVRAGVAAAGQPAAPGESSGRSSVDAAGRPRFLNAGAPPLHPEARSAGQPERSEGAVGRASPPALARAAGQPRPDEKPLRFGCVAFAGESSSRAYRQIRDYLPAELGRDVVITVYPNYHDVIADLVNDQLELAVLPPLVYLNARRQRPLDTLAFGVYAATGSFSYRSVILVPRRSPAKTVADLSGRRMAFVDIMSASGYVLPKAALVQAGVRDKRDVKGKFYDNHVDAVRAMMRGDADAVATYDMIYSDSAEIAARKDELRTLWTGDLVIPSDAVVATAAVPRAEQKQIRTALLSYFAAQQKRSAPKNAIYEGFVPADPNLYSDIERFLKNVTSEK